MTAWSCASGAPALCASKRRAAYWGGRAWVRWRMRPSSVVPGRRCNGTDGSGRPRAASRRRGIGSQDYFDRYVVFTVPADDLPEAVFQQALAQLAAGTEDDEAAQLLLRLRPLT